MTVVQSGRFTYSASATSRTSSDEIEFFEQWNSDIARAARAAAKGNRSKAEDYAQHVRTHLLTVIRDLPDAPTPYIRTVIANSLRRVQRRDANTWNALVPLEERESADEHTDAPDVRTAIIANWATRLPPQLRRVYVNLYEQGRSQRETAKLIGVTQPRIAQLHLEVLERAREELGHILM